MIEALSMRVCIVLDARMRRTEILAAITAIQTFKVTAYNKIAGWNSIYPDKKKLEDYKLTVVCPELWMNQIVERLLEPVEIRYTTQAICRDEFDYYVYLDFNVVESIQKIHSKKHLAQIFGIMLGGDSDSLPFVGMLKIEKPQQMYDIGVINTNSGVINTNSISGAIFSALQKAMPNNTFCRLDISEDENIDKRANKLGSVRMVVGILSFSTYLATAMNRGVLEIFLDDDSKYYLSKFMSKKYRQFVIQERDWVPELIVGVKNLWQKIEEMTAYANKQRLDSQAEKAVPIIETGH
jgi:hypothetical protein